MDVLERMRGVRWERRLISPCRLGRLCSVVLLGVVLLGAVLLGAILLDGVLTGIDGDERSVVDN